MTDIGLRVIGNIHRQLLIDEEWTTRKPRSFSWIGSRLEQTCHATELFEDADMLFGDRNFNRGGLTTGRV